MRVFVFNGNPVKATVIQKGTCSAPGLCVTLQSAEEITRQIQDNVQSLLQKMLGLAIDLQPFYAMAEAHGKLMPLVGQFLGVRPPRFPDIFEALINAIACQQVTLDVGILMLDRLSERFGVRFAGKDAASYAFPRPEDLVDVPEGDIKKLGLSLQKAKAIKNLAASVLEKKIDLKSLESMNNHEAAAYLSAVRGIGRWSAEYVLLRGLGRLDSFPGDDSGAQSNIRRIFHLAHKPGYEEIRSLTSQWHPYEGLVYFHLLLEKLHMKGVL